MVDEPTPLAPPAPAVTVETTTKTTEETTTLAPVAVAAPNFAELLAATPDEQKFIPPVIERRRRAPLPTWHQRLVNVLDLDNLSNDGKILFTKYILFPILAVESYDVVVRGANAANSFIVFSVIVAAFGRKHLDAWLSRITVSIGASHSSTKTETKETRNENVTNTQITERRGVGAEDGTEPT